MKPGTCRCNNCMTILDETVKECPKCKTEAYLMQPYEDVQVWETHNHDLHPYECDPDKCIHCKGVVNEKHDPKRCWLCCDGNPDLPPEER